MFRCHCLRLRVETNIALCAKFRDKEYNGYIMNIKRKLFSQQKKNRELILSVINIQWTVTSFTTMHRVFIRVQISYNGPLFL